MSGGGKAKASQQERALAGNAARQWNDYVERYIPVENKFIERTQATDARVNEQRGVANADASLAYRGAADQVHAGLAAQGAAPGSGRSAVGHATLSDARATSSGLGQAMRGQAVHDREQNARVKMSAFGRDLADQSQLSLGNQARRATNESMQSMERATARRNRNLSSAMGLAGHATQYQNRHQPAINQSYSFAQAAGSQNAMDSLNRFRR